MSRFLNKYGLSVEPVRLVIAGVISEIIDKIEGTNGNRTDSAESLHMFIHV